MSLRTIPWVATATAGWWQNSALPCRQARETSKPQFVHHVWEIAVILRLVTVCCFSLSALCSDWLRDDLSQRVRLSASLKERDVPDRDSLETAARLHREASSELSLSCEFSSSVCFQPLRIPNIWVEFLVEEKFIPRTELHRDSLETAARPQRRSQKLSLSFELSFCLVFSFPAKWCAWQTH